MIRIATDNDIDIICKLRILQQKEDWKEEHIDELSFYDMTKKFLENHFVVSQTSRLYVRF